MKLGSWISLMLITACGGAPPVAPRLTSKQAPAVSPPRDLAAVAQRRPQRPQLVWHDGGYTLVYHDDGTGHIGLRVALDGGVGAPVALPGSFGAVAAASPDHLGLFFGALVERERHVRFTRLRRDLTPAGAPVDLGPVDGAPTAAIYNEDRDEWLAVWTRTPDETQPHPLPTRRSRSMNRPVPIDVVAARVSSEGQLTARVGVASARFQRTFSLSRPIWNGSAYALAYAPDDRVIVVELRDGGPRPAFELATGPVSGVAIAWDGRGYGLVYRELGNPERLVFVRVVDGRERARTAVSRATPAHALGLESMTFHDGAFAVVWTDATRGSFGSRLSYAEVAPSARVRVAPRRLARDTPRQGQASFAVGGPWHAVTYVTGDPNGPADVRVARPR